MITVSTKYTSFHECYRTDRKIQNVLFYGESVCCMYGCRDWQEVRHRKLIETSSQNMLLAVCSEVVIFTFVYKLNVDIHQ